MPSKPFIAVMSCNQIFSSPSVLTQPSSTGATLQNIHRPSVLEFQEFVTFRCNRTLSVPSNCANRPPETPKQRFSPFVQSHPSSAGRTLHYTQLLAFPTLPCNQNLPVPFRNPTCRSPPSPSVTTPIVAKSHRPNQNSICHASLSPLRKWKHAKSPWQPRSS